MAGLIRRFSGEIPPHGCHFRQRFLRFATRRLSVLATDASVAGRISFSALRISSGTFVVRSAANFRFSIIGCSAPAGDRTIAGGPPGPT